MIVDELWKAILVRKSWLKRRTGLEKVLLTILGVSCAAVMVTGVVVFTGRQQPQVDTADWSSRQQDVCTTPECALAGSEKYFYLSSKYFPLLWSRGDHTGHGPHSGSLWGFLQVLLRRLDGQQRHPWGKKQVGPLLWAERRSGWCSERFVTLVVLIHVVSASELMISML